MPSSDDSTLPGDALPDVSDVPGEQSKQFVDRLSRTECPAITARRARREEQSGVDQDPMVWERASGANVEDVDGNRFVDLTSAFAVAGLGHNPPAVVEAAKSQADDLIHAMGDVYPGRTKVELCDRLAEVTPGDLQQSILGLSGSDAVQAALKTATVATGKPGAVAFWGGYHGLAYGALGLTAYREAFREPFQSQLNQHVHHVPYPNPADPPFDGVETAGELRDRCLDHLVRWLDGPATGSEGVGAVVVEPIQGRGGKVVPPQGFLSGLREICDDRDLVMIVDEIYTGFARTGPLFACQREGVVPDVLCVGKAMGGGFPVSAAVGRPEVMEQWELSTGEAIHTQTFLGNPLGCAMARAAIDEIVDEGWPDRVQRRAPDLRDRLADVADDSDAVADLRGRGFMWGLELRDDGEPAPERTLQVVDALRRRGYLVLPSGTQGNVLGITPPFVITDDQLDAFTRALADALDETTE